MEVVVELWTNHEDTISKVDHVMLRNTEPIDGSLAIDALFLLPIDLIVHES